MHKELELRMRELLPPEEFPLFVSSLDKLSLNPNKSLRINSRHPVDLSFLVSQGLSLEGEIPFLKNSNFEKKTNFFKKESLLFPDKHPLVAAGIIYIQEASAMEVVTHLDVKPGMRVLDLCAAPGGKSTQILDELQGEGFLVVNEFNRERAKKCDSMIARWGYLNVAITSMDSKNCKNYFKETFDRVLVDAPCSSESYFAKRKEKRKDVSSSENLRMSELQFELLQDAYECLKPGGQLIYSTCTYSKTENEEVVQRLLHEQSQNHFLPKLIKEQRRWPHRDHVPGGYFAVIKKQMNPLFFKPEIETDAFFRSQIQSVKEIVRIGDIQWDGEVNEYASLMAGKILNLETISLNLNEVRLFLKCQWSGDQTKLKKKVCWENFPIGFFQYGKGIRSYQFPKNI